MLKPKQLNSGLLLLGALLAAVTALFVFGWIAEEMLEGDTQKIDMFVRGSIHQHATPGLTRVMQAFSFLGSVGTVSALCVLILGASLYFRRFHMAALLAITMLGMAVLDEALKMAFRRPRPVAFFGPTPNSYSFPSGHAFGSVCFYGVLAAILAARVRGTAAKWCIWTGAVLLMGIIGFSRIYLGVHYPSDVIAGFCAGAVWVAAIGFLDRFIRERHKAELSGRKNTEADESYVP
jgi:undecaprenyl-diphosphatase